MSITLYTHQKKMADFWLKNRRSFNLSDAGTGKTLASIDAFFRSKNRKKMLIFAPKSILKAAWAADIKKYGGLISIVIDSSSIQKKIESFNCNIADIYICTHECCKFILENKLDISRFSHVILDESTAYKNHSSQRSKAIKCIVQEIENVLLLSGTPMNSSVEDLWYPTKLIDGGERLGKYLREFRDNYRLTLANPRFNQYVDKPGSRKEISEQIADITIRYKLKDCVDLPKQSTHDVFCNITKETRATYNSLKNDIGIYTTNNPDKQLTALHAATKANKLLQVLSGAVYNESGEVINVSSERYELIAEIAKQRRHSVIVYHWTHQLTELKKALSKLKLSHEHIGGDVALNRRSKIINDFQAGKYRTLIIHAISCSHGITLTRATSVIWSSPTYSAECYEQVNARIHRISQESKTEIIRIAARDTKEIEVYKQLNKKVSNLADMLKLVAN